MIERLCSKHVVLLGIGHTNAHVLRMWQMGAPPDTDLTCVSNFPVATYSGMLPAVLAGQIPPSRMKIDLVRLCAAANARLILDPVVGLDSQRRELLFPNRPPVAFDVLSIGIGSTASFDGVAVNSDTVVAIKPMQTFLDRLRDTIASAQQRHDKTLHVMIVGGGVAGIEIAFCLPRFIAEQTSQAFQMQLVTSSSTLAPELNESTRRRIAKRLVARNIDVQTGKTVARVDDTTVTFQDGSTGHADIVIWAAKAGPPELLKKLGLATDDRGFLATDDTLQSTSLPGVFAVGDSGTILGANLPKAGVYAVRQGPVLWENIQRTLTDRPLVSYRPQTSFLKLINCGDGTAIGQWKRWSVEGRWVMRWKARIDGGFMEMYQVTPMQSDHEGSGQVDDMQCRGCGCKLGAEVLESAIQEGASVELEDAAPVADGQWLASTDFFSSPVNDPFLAGRIAAIHSASDIVVSGAKVSDALANVVLPDGDPAAQQRTLRDLLAGSRLEFDSLDASVVGGHTIVGPRMEIGFTVIGKPISTHLIRKSNLGPGDQLWVTKPIGTGVLMAAHMRLLCPAEHYLTMIDVMLQRQHQLADVAIQLGIDAGTDVTGFGLAGHLIEMLTASGVAAEIDLEAVPLLPGAVEMVDQGVASTLFTDNLRCEHQIVADQSVQRRPEYRLLFDPQTCGGMLLGIPDNAAETFQSEAIRMGLYPPKCIGIVSAKSTSSPLVVKSNALQPTKDAAVPQS